MLAKLRVSLSALSGREGALRTRARDKLVAPSAHKILLSEMWRSTAAHLRASVLCGLHPLVSDASRRICGYDDHCACAGRLSSNDHFCYCHTARGVRGTTMRAMDDQGHAPLAVRIGAAMMTKWLMVFLLGAGLAVAQDHRQMNERGDMVMGFSHDKTTHHFQLSYDGGAIDVRANDIRDTESRDEIRSHFKHIAAMFADGNFRAPMLVHGTNAPGTATMSKLRDQLHWSLSETPRGARLTVVADDQLALDAVHEFLRFQIQDHQTGDCQIPH